MANFILGGYVTVMLWALAAGHFILFGVLLAFLAVAIWQTADEL